jgi:hypothetical protein
MGARFSKSIAFYQSNLFATKNNLDTLYLCKPATSITRTTTMLDNKLNSSWWALRIGIGLAAFLAGADKFFNILTDWGMYLSPIAERLLPVSGETFMHAAGVVEMAVGLAILTRWTKIGAYIASAWLVLIAVNLLTSGGFFDIAVRDVEVAIAAFVLAQLTALRQPATAVNLSQQALGSKPAQPATTA